MQQSTITVHHDIVLYYATVRNYSPPRHSTVLCNSPPPHSSVLYNPLLHQSVLYICPMLHTFAPNNSQSLRNSAQYNSPQSQFCTLQHYNTTVRHYSSVYATAHRYCSVLWNFTAIQSQQLGIMQQFTTTWLCTIQQSITSGL